MKDELRRCANCDHEHPYGIRAYSPDNVPLYGAWRCEVRDCGCRNFVEYHEETVSALALTQEDTNLLWEKTSFLNPQVPAATRIAVAQLETLEGAEREKAFMSLMISQLTDVRGAMTREDSKFAHLVAHTDEVVESMRGVSQLKERIENTNARIGEFDDRLYQIEESIKKIADYLVAEKKPPPPTIPPSLGRRVFNWFSGLHLRDEAILTDAEPASDK